MPGNRVMALSVNAPSTVALVCVPASTIAMPAPITTTRAHHPSPSRISTRDIVDRSLPPSFFLDEAKSIPPMPAENRRAGVPGSSLVRLQADGLDHLRPAVHLGVVKRGDFLRRC